MPEPGWLGGAYDLVRAIHVIFVIFWMAGMFMLPRYLVYQHPVVPGSDEDRLWIERSRRLQRIIVNPSMVIVWLLGLMLAFNIGWTSGGWLHAKLALVLLFSGYHGWLAKTRKRFAAGQRPYSEKALRLLNEVPGLVTIVAVILVIVKPF